MMNRAALPTLCSLVILAFCLTPQTAFAQEGPDLNDSYLMPPESIAVEILAPRHRNVTLSDLNPNREYFLNTLQQGITPLSHYARQHYNIAGLQIDPNGNRHRFMTTLTPTVGLELIGARDGEQRELVTPEDVTITHTSWSPDGEKLAWFGHYEEATHLYVTDLESGMSTRITTQPVLATLNISFEWSGDSRYLFTVLIPDERGEEPVRQQTPTKLQVRVTSPEENRLRTYPSLLEDHHEEALLKHYTTGQLARIDVETGDLHRIGEPAMIQNIDIAPSGEHAIVQTVVEPFSHIVPVRQFAWTEEIWDLDGNVLTELRKSEARVGVPDHDELEDYGRRDIQWRPDGEGLSFLKKTEEDEENGKRSDNGDPADNGDDMETEPEENDKNDKQDRVMQWLPPFGEDDLHVVYTSEREMESVSYENSAETLFITERQGINEHLYAVFPDEPDTTYTIYKFDRDAFYEHPGNLMHRPGTLGMSVVQMSGERDYVFLSGTEYDEEYSETAPRPFLDRVEIRTGEAERIFQSSEEVHEQVTAVLDDEIDEIVLERQSADMHPDSWHYSVASGDRTRLTDNVDYNEAVTRAYRDRFKVRRADGFEFWMEVVMPADWDGERLPGIIWHYPREFDDQEDYDESQRRYNKNRYPSVGTRTADILVKEGYAVLRPDWPIAGERGTSNDNFVWSIVQNSTAVIDSADARGYIDRARMAIGGHSYGAFGTANAMIHTSFFKAGIAGAGNYNRTLTPMGFQRERSDLWRGMDRYLQMSPIFWAERIDGALLMYHGAVDQNVGTWPTNSRRLFHALNGLGKTAVMYMYPYEGHGPSAEETLLDMWKRWADWLDYYVKEDGYRKAMEAEKADTD